MYPSNQPPAGPNPHTPSLAPQPGVWPPRPVVEGDSQATAVEQPAWFQFTEEYRRVEGHVSDFRTGWVGLSPTGVSINGKAVLRAEIRNLILVLSLIFGVGVVIAHVVLEYACRMDAALQLSWDQVKKIVISPKAQRVCLVFTAPNYKGKVKTFSLAFRMNQAGFDAFVENARAYAPDQVAEGRIRGATSIIIWIFLGLLIALILTALIFAATSSGSR